MPSYRIRERWMPRQQSNDANAREYRHPTCVEMKSTALDGYRAWGARRLPQAQAQDDTCRHAAVPVKNRAKVKNTGTRRRHGSVTDKGRRITRTASLPARH
jgi:hypothetical protein